MLMQVIRHFVQHWYQVICITQVILFVSTLDCLETVPEFSTTDEHSHSIFISMNGYVILIIFKNKKSLLTIAVNERNSHLDVQTRSCDGINVFTLGQDPLTFARKYILELFLYVNISNSIND